MTDEGLCEHAHLLPCPYCLIESLRRQLAHARALNLSLQLGYDRAVGELRLLQYKSRERRARRYRDTGQ